MTAKNFSSSVLVSYFIPFLKWLPELKNGTTLRVDIIAGVTVALVLIPQSMAYAQLAGLPPYFGLYAAFLPPFVAAIFGSSRQLATGPVAVVSLLTAAALEPLATTGSEGYIAYAILLALFVGLFQLSLGLLRLGVLVNFLSHPVVLGFTNAAAIIIATSQLGKIFGVTVPKAAYHYKTVWDTVVAAISHFHLPTFGMAVLAFIIMVVVKRINPKIPGVLLAVVITTILSLAVGFQTLQTINKNQLIDGSTQDIIATKLELPVKIEKFDKRVSSAQKKHDVAVEKYGSDNRRALSTQIKLESLKRQRDRHADGADADFKRMKTLIFNKTKSRNDKSAKFYPDGEVPDGVEVEPEIWRISSLNKDGALVMHSGGKVVGTIPQGLPAIKIPSFDIDVLGQLFFAAVAIALIGFMEAISIAKAMAARTRQRLDANQELVGQGLSNIFGSLFQSYPVSGSFSRSAVNLGAGAITGFSSVVTAVVVVITLLWLTPLLYHLPQATLAAVIMMAVIGLVNFRALLHTWHVRRDDGVVAVITFVLTLLFAPHLDSSLMIGVILSLAIFLYRTMEPRIAALSRHPDGSLRDADVYGLGTCENISMLRFDGSLYFANISYFEDKVLGIAANKPDLKYIIVDGPGINQIDASGEEMLTSITERLQAGGVVILFSRFKKQVMDVLRNSGFVERLGSDRFFRKNEMALEFAWKGLGNDHEVECPLNIVCAIDEK